MLNVQEAGVETADLEVEEVVVEGNGNGVVEAEAPQTYEDFWTPQVAPAPGGEFVEEYGPIRPLPEHDGTDCLKWDNTLWSHGEHFKVGPLRDSPRCMHCTCPAWLSTTTSS